MKSQTRGLANAANTTYHIWPFFLNLKSYFTIKLATIQTSWFNAIHVLLTISAGRITACRAVWLPIGTFQEVQNEETTPLDHIILIMGWWNNYIKKITHVSCKWHNLQAELMFSPKGERWQGLCEGCLIMIQTETRQQTAVSLWSQLPGEGGHTGN